MMISIGGTGHTITTTRNRASVCIIHSVYNTRCLTFLCVVIRPNSSLEEEDKEEKKIS